MLTLVDFLQCGNEFYLPRQFDNIDELLNWTFAETGPPEGLQNESCPQCGKDVYGTIKSVKWCENHKCTWSNDPELSKRLEVYVKELDRLIRVDGLINDNA